MRWISLMRDTCMFLFKRFSKCFIPESVSVKENKKCFSYGVTLNVAISSFQYKFTFTFAAVTLLIFSLASLHALRVIFRCSLATFSDKHFVIFILLGIPISTVYQVFIISY